MERKSDPGPLTATTEFISAGGRGRGIGRCEVTGDHG